MLSSSQIEPASLRSTGLFAGLDDEALDTLIGCLQVQHVESGECVFEEGDAGSTLYVVAAGSIELHKALDGSAMERGPLCVATIGAGDWFGDVALLGITQRAVAAIAKQPCVLWSLQAGALRQLYRLNMKAYALLMMNLARELARKLQKVEGELVRLKQANPAATPTKG